MNRDEGCPDCKKLTAGDCGKHGPAVIFQGGAVFNQPDPMSTEITRLQRALADQQAQIRELRAALEDALITTRNYYAMAISRSELENHQERWKAALLPSHPEDIESRIQETGEAYRAALRQRPSAKETDTKNEDDTRVDGPS